MHGIENEYKTQDDGWNTTRNVDCKTYDTLHYNQRLRLTTIQHHGNGQSMQLEFQNDQ